MKKCESFSVSRAVSQVITRVLYSPRNDPDPAMTPNPEMIPTDPQIDTEMIPISLHVDPEMIPN